MEQTTTQGKQEQPTTTQAVEKSTAQLQYEERVQVIVTGFEAGFIGKDKYKPFTYILFPSKIEENLQQLTLRVGSINPMDSDRQYIIDLIFRKDDILLKSNEQDASASFSYQEGILNTVFKLLDNKLETLEIKLKSMQPAIANELDKLGVPKEPEAVHINTEEPSAWVAKDAVKTPWPVGNGSLLSHNTWGVGSTIFIDSPVYDSKIEVYILNENIGSSNTQIKDNNLTANIPVNVNVGGVAALSVELTTEIFKATACDIYAKGHFELHVAYLTNLIWLHLEAYRMYEKEIQKQKATVQQAAV